MADPRFFTSAGPFSVTRLTAEDGIEKCDNDIELSGLSSLSEAGASDLSFFSDVKLKSELAASRAGAVLVKAEHAELVPDGCLALLCDDPYRSMAAIAQIFFPEAAQSRPPNAAQGAAENVHPDAVLGDNVTLEPNVVIGAGAQIGDGCYIGAHAHIGHGVVLGRDCIMSPTTRRKLPTWCTVRM